MPTDYVTQLAAQAYREFAAGIGQEIEKLLGKSPWDAAEIAQILASRPDLQAKVASFTGYTPSHWVLEHELGQLDARRKVLNIDPVNPDGGPYTRAANSGLMGLCFSGGGIRSATFNLGVLQALAELRLLRCVDYLSSVSGGGYIHQWFAAWTTRQGFEHVSQQLIPLPEKDNPGTHPEPIRWLRRYSNYLTPEKGLLSADTWVALAIWLRNTLLNQAILITGLFFLALVPHLFVHPFVIPRHGPAAVAFIGAIFYLSVSAIYKVGVNLQYFVKADAGGKGTSSQVEVQQWLVLPLLVSALLFTLLLPMMSATAFGFNLLLSFFLSSLILLTLSLTITLAGGVPLSYLKSHQRTALYGSVREFWKEKPKCYSHLKFVFAILAMSAASLLAAVCGAIWMVGVVVLGAKLSSFAGGYWWRLALVIEPPLILVGPLLTMLLAVGLLGRTFQDARREWLSRLAAWMGLWGLLWILSFGFSLFGYFAVVWLWHKLWAGESALVAWLVTSLGGLFAAKSSQTSGAKSDSAATAFSPLEFVALVAPYVFIAGLLLLISAWADTVLRTARSAGPFALIAVFFVPALVCLLFAWRVDINEFSLHAFYRNRLARCYLGASNIPRHPNPFTGFDEADANVPVSDLLPGHGYYGPFPIFCTALNLTFGDDLAWQERKAASFAFTPLYSGYDVGWTAARGPANLRFNGFVETANYAYPRPGIHINTAVAISGAALSPNSGYHSNAATAFLLTVFNVRLGWWLRNPRVLSENGTRLEHEGEVRPDGNWEMLRDPYPWPSPHFSLISLIKELLGRTNDTSKYVYLTDGGHFDNMGLYELVRRRCRFIVICDSEDDGDLGFQGIGMAIRKCRIDFGAEIALDLRPLHHMGDTQRSAAHCVVGSIRYPEDSGAPGVVVYIKSSLTGDEPADILSYKKEHPTFPHDTTVNQWFTESQFESYRRLGHHVAFSVFEPAEPDSLDCATIQGRAAYFKSLGNIWCAPTPEMERHSGTHTARYDSLLQELRNDVHLPGLFDMLFAPGGDAWKTGRNVDQIQYAVRFSSELIEFMWLVFSELNLVLPEKRNHPHAQGWSQIFAKWAKIDVVQDGWRQYCQTYSQSFRNFAQSSAVGLPDN
jgi:hypothetical protein